MTYSDDGATVYYGRYTFNECYALPDGWRNNWCAAYWWPYGWDSVYTNTEGEFEYAGGHWRHYHKAQFDGWPGGWNAWCSQSGGTVPFGWWTCQGSRTVTNR